MMSRWFPLALLSAALALTACNDPAPVEEPPMDTSDAPADDPTPATTARATFGGGCFWCTEAVYQELDGVTSVTSGYAGGETEDPTYQEVCAGITGGHAEVVQVTYDPARVTYEALLEVFFKTHDPTTLNRQGADVGTQYRSIILAHDEAQRETAVRIVKALDASGAYENPIVTEIVDLETFYPAEDYHQDYFANNARQPYCQAVIVPKLEKFRAVFRDRLRSD
jgi:peptide-methionine (S)-S-oxide reductase